MKKLILPLLLMFSLIACKQPNPSETARQFVTSLYLLDYDGAAELTSADTKNNVTGKKVQPTEQNAQARSRNFSDNDFMLDSLKETQNGNTAVVESEGITIPMVKEDKLWKVKASDELIADILNRKEKNDALQTKWVLLQRAYDNRMQAAKEYVQFQSQAGTITSDGQALLELIANTSLPEKFTRKQQEEYTSRQAEMTTLISKTVVPTYTASADFSMNLIIRINEADNSIEKAKAEYNSVAKGLRSPVYLAEIK